MRNELEIMFKEVIVYNLVCALNHRSRLESDSSMKRMKHANTPTANYKY